MLLIYSTTLDTTIDLLIYHMGQENVFRLNFDQFDRYKIIFGKSDIQIIDPNGRLATLDNVNKVLWRKPALRENLLINAPEYNDEEKYIEKEIWYVFRELINLFWVQEKVVLIEPFVDQRVGKFVQYFFAKEYFDIVDYEFRFKAKKIKFNNPVVVKSLTMQPIDKKEHLVIFTTKAEEEELDLSNPWMIQQYIDAVLDVTVVFIRDKLYAFELERSQFIKKTIDWRELSVDITTDKWELHKLPKAIESKIFALMHDLKLHFGRLDFLFDGKSYYFLEVNPNGQWIWLDASNSYGVLKKFIDEIDPKNPVFPIPKRWG